MNKREVLEMAVARKKTLQKLLKITKRDADIMFEFDKDGDHPSDFTKRLHKDVSSCMTDIALLDYIIEDLEQEVKKEEK